MISNIFFFLIAILCAYLLLLKKVRNNQIWMATVTPLASIIGSGFLVIVPLLGHNFSIYAPLAMCLIIVVAYLVGGALRYNICHFEDLSKGRLSQDSIFLRVNSLSISILGFSYIISVAFYLRLLSSFLLRGFSVESDILAKSITSAILFMIGVSGKFKGLRVLERLEEYSVSIKIAIIVSLIFGWGFYDISHFGQGVRSSIDPQHFDFIHSLRILAGALIVVQGFETSQYLGHSYSQDTRVKTMKRAQIISGVIYILFVALTVPTFTFLNEKIDDTAIITLSQNVSIIFPAMLIVAALMSQFSAAVADTIGAGGLISQNIRGKLRPTEKNSYLIVTVLGIVLIWLANIFEIISLASRAFAFYYALQCIVATLMAKREGKNLFLFIYYFLLSILLLAATLFALPAD